MPRIRTIAALVVGGALIYAPAADAHTLPISYAIDKAQPALKRYWQNWGGGGHEVIGASRLSSCRRVNRHTVTCRSSTRVYDPQYEQIGPGRATVTVRFLFERSFITQARVRGGIWYPVDCPPVIDCTRIV